MLASIIRLERPLIVFDLETDGLKNARIVEIGHEVHRPDGTVSAYRTLVDPERPIGEDSTHVHGIKDEDVKACRSCRRPLELHRGDAMLPGVPTRECEGFKPWPKFVNVAQAIAKGYTNCDFAGKNVRFDLRVLAENMQRVGVQWSYAGACVIDAERLEALLEPRDLSSLYRRRLGREPEGAHGAADDVRMTREIICDQLSKGGRVLPLDLKRLHELQWPGWIDTEGKLRRGRDGTVALTFGKHAGTDVRRVDPSYWKWVAGADFSEEFKALAAGMAAGRFP
jgi:DNA polymerase III subunit epsilon